MASPLANFNQSDPTRLPPGFTLTPSNSDEIVILHRRTGMGCMNVFLMAWWIFWTGFTIFLVRQFFTGGTMDDGGPIQGWFVLLFVAADVVVFFLLLYLLFCKKWFCLARDELRIVTDILGFRRTLVFAKTEIDQIAQVKDGGGDDDSFPSWGLKIEGSGSKTLLYRQPYEQSLWLGRILGVWAGVPFVSVPKENNRPKQSPYLND